jgi:hypothetical protein
VLMMRHCPGAVPRPRKHYGQRLVHDNDQSEIDESPFAGRRTSGRLGIRSVSKTMG